MKFKKEKVKEISTFKNKKRITATISNPLKMLKMFTKDLYKFPIQTAIQEYINNAKDAHKMIGKSTATIEIIGPTLANQQVVIKDKGPGLSPVEMEEVFARITSSNKDDSDLFNGGFGIGSKSWFSVNNTFSVVSNYNGVKYFYNIIFSDNIYVDLDLEQKTDDENGVEVYLPLSSADQIPEAQKAIRRATKYWRTKPIISNCVPFHFQVFFQNNDFTIYRSLSPSDKLEVTLGETIYSIKDLSSYKTWSKHIHNYNVAIHFNVGEAKIKKSQEVGPDRENFVQEMEGVILKKFNKVLEIMPKVAKNHIEALTDPQEISTEMSSSHYYQGSKRKVSYGGFEIVVSTISDQFSLELPIFTRYGKSDLMPIDLNPNDLDLNKNSFIVIKDIDLSKKEIERTLSSRVRGNENVVTYGLFNSKLTKEQEEFLKKYEIETRLLSDLQFVKEEEVFNDDLGVWVMQLGNIQKEDLVEYPYVGFDKLRKLGKKKIKIGKLNKEIPLISARDFKDLKAQRIYISSLGIDAYETAKKNIEPMVALGFKELDLEEVRNLALAHWAKKKAEKEARVLKEKRLLELKLEKSKKEAASPQVQEIMRWYSLYKYLDNQLDGYASRWLTQIKKIETKNENIKKLQSIEFPKDFLNKADHWSQFAKFKQDKELISYLEKIRREYPLTYTALFERLSRNPYLKEINILLNNIKD